MSRMTKTDYLSHLLDEYASYLKKAVANAGEKTFTFSPMELAAALMKAFEKGAMKGVLYESLDDVTKATKSAIKEDVKKEKPVEHKSAEKQMSQDEALKALTNLLSGLLGDLSK